MSENGLREQLGRVIENMHEYHCKRLKGELHALDACAICNVIYVWREFAAVPASGAARPNICSHCGVDLATLPPEANGYLHTSGACAASGAKERDVRWSGREQFQRGTLFGIGKGLAMAARKVDELMEHSPKHDRELLVNAIEALAARKPKEGEK
jgi:hypothetical protein